MSSEWRVKVVQFGQTRSSEGAYTGRTGVVAELVDGSMDYLQELESLGVDLGNLPCEVVSVNGQRLMSLSLSCLTWTPSRMAELNQYNYMAREVIPESFRGLMESGGLFIGMQQPINGSKKRSSLAASPEQ